MAKEIGIKLKITSEGKEKVISTLTELETELSTLQSKLKTLDFGSAAFKEAATNIQILKTKIDDIDKSTEGLGAEKRFRAIGDAINILTGSFQVLSGAIGLVVSDEQTLEEVQRAEKAALDVLNIALGINAINTALVESATLRKAAADKIATLATRASTIAQAAWNAVLLANPIGLVIAGVAALTGAIYLLVKATNTETDAEEELNKQLEISKDLQNELAIEAKKAAQEEKIAISILTDNVKQRNLELKVLEDLKKEYPGFNAFISENNELTSRGNEFLTKSIALQEIEAKLKALRDKKNEVEIQNLEDYNKELESQNTTWGKLSASIRGGLNPFGKYVVIARDLNAATEEGNRKLKVYNDEIQNLQGQYDKALGEVKPFTDELDKQRKAEEAAAKAAQKAADNVEKRRQAEIKSLQDRINAQKKYLTDLKVLVGQENDVNDKLIEKLEDIINKQNELLKKRTEDVKTESKKLQEELNQFLFGVVPGEDLKPKLDVFTSIFTQVNTAIQTGLVNPFEVGRKTIEEFTKELSKTGSSWQKFARVGADAVAGLTPELKETLTDFFNLFGRFQQELGSEEFRKTFGKAFDPKTAQENLVKIQNAAKELLQDTTLLPGELEVKLSKRIQSILGLSEKQVKGTELQKIAAQGYNEELTILTETLIKFGTQQAGVVIQAEENAKKISKANGEINKSTDLLGRQISKGAMGDVEYIKLTAEEIDFLGKRIKESSSASAKAYTDFVEGIINNTGQIRDKYLKVLSPQDLIKIIKEGAKGLKDLNFETEQDVANLIQSLQTLQVQLGDAITTTAVDASGEVVQLGTGYNNLAEIIDLLIKKQKELKEATKDTAKTWQETFSESNFKKVADIILSSFTTISTQLSSIIQQSNSLLLEQLEYQKEQALAVIGEANTESEAENKKILAEREKVEKEYAKKKFDAEKTARVQELQFGLANAIAQGAQAIINAYATLPTPAAVPFSVILAGLTAAQVSLIKDQINFVQSKAYIGRTGGLVEGSSHDTYGGGVPTMLEGGEFILNREAVRAFGDQISMMSSATGGKPMSIDDSRIVQAIAKQNLSTKTPLKAYVLYNDIKDTNKLNNKIEQLSRL